MPRKLNTYRVWYSQHTSAKVQAYSIQGARQQAWSQLAKGYRYGWDRADFMKNASVKKLD